MDKVLWDSKEYDLAKNTMKIANLIEKAEQAKTMREAYKAQMDLVKASMGEDTAQEVLETLNIEEVDLGTLTLVYNAVIEGYEKRLIEMKKEQEKRLVDSPTVRTVKDLADNVKILSSVPGMR